MQEIVEKRGRNSKTFDLGGGKRLLEAGNHSHVLKNGLWIPTNTNLVEETGTDADTAFQYIAKSRSESLDYDIKFGKNDPVWMKIKHIQTGKKVIFKPKHNNNNPYHTVVGNKISVSQAWDGIDLEIFVTDYGVKTNYIITAEEGQRVIEYDVSGDLDSLRSGKPWYKTPDGPPVLVPSSFSSGVISFDFTAVPVGAVVDPTTTLQPGASGYDLQINSLAPTTNYDGSPLYVADAATAIAAYRALLKWDLSSIDASSTVTDATISLYEDDAGRSGGALTWDTSLHVINVSWVTSEATWNIRSTGTAWTAVGCSNTADRTNTVSAQVTLDPTAANAFIDWTDAQLITDVQNFVDGSVTNNGWLLQAPGGENYSGYCYSGFASSSNATESRRPKITVTYTATSAAVGCLVGFSSLVGGSVLCGKGNLIN